MIKRTFTFCLTALTLILMQAQLIRAQDFTITISTATTEIGYGDPVILHLNLVFSQPRAFPATGKSQSTFALDGLALLVKNKEWNETYVLLYRLPLKFRLVGPTGVHYATTALVFCDLYEERKTLIKKMLFDRPGTYRLVYLRESQEVSNSLDIEVKPSSAGERAISLLADPNDLAFLLTGLHRKPRTTAQLEAVITQCQGTLLAKYAAARLGIEEAAELKKRYPNYEKFAVEYRGGMVIESMVEHALTYLSQGLRLPDAFPIREEVLYEAARIEVIRGNYAKAFSLLDELALKYQHGEYGRKAIVERDLLKGLPIRQSMTQ